MNMYSTGNNCNLQLPLSTLETIVQIQTTWTYIGQNYDNLYPSAPSINKATLFTG